MECYDTRSGEFQHHYDVILPFRAKYTAVVIAGTVFLIGGVDGVQPYNKTVFSFPLLTEIDNERWVPITPTTLAPMPHMAALRCCVAFESSIMVVYSHVSLDGDELRVQLYDIPLNTWTTGVVNHSSVNDLRCVDVVRPVE